MGVGQPLVGSLPGFVFHELADFDGAKNQYVRFQARDRRPDARRFHSRATSSPSASL